MRKFPDRRDAAVRFIEKRRPALRTALIGLDAVRPIKAVPAIFADTRAGDALHLAPIRRTRQSRAHGTVVPTIDDHREIERGEIAI